MPETTNTKSDTHSVKLGVARPYQELDILTYDRYWRFGLDLSGVHYAFASNLGSIVIDTNEFKEVGADFPIVFMTDDLYLPHAVMGLLSHLNLAVNAPGVWQAGLHQPFRIRLYPFGIVEFEDFEQSSLTAGTAISEKDDVIEQKQKLLAIDATSPLLVSLQNNAAAQPLFNSDGTTTTVVHKAAEMVQEIERWEVGTRQFMAAMKANDVFIDKPLRVHFNNGTQLTLKGFSIISKRAVKNLSQTTLSRWEKQGYLSLIKYHWKSHDKWKNIISLYEKRMQRDIRVLQEKAQDSQMGPESLEV